MCLEFVHFYQQTFYLIFFFFFYNPDSIDQMYVFSLFFELNSNQWILSDFDMWYNLILYPLPFLSVVSFVASDLWFDVNAALRSMDVWISDKLLELSNCFANFRKKKKHCESSITSLKRTTGKSGVGDNRLSETVFFFFFSCPFLLFIFLYLWYQND